MVTIYNPLPSVLAHYEAELQSTLASSGYATRVIRTSTESLSRTAKLLALFRHVATSRRLIREGGVIVVVWPLLGWLEPWLWQSKRGQPARVTVIVHDPLPLRRQIGLSRWAEKLLRLLPEVRWPEVLCHSDLAASVVCAAFSRAPVHVVPHPMLRPSGTRQAPVVEGRVLVLGQYKPARDIQLLERLAPAMVEAGYSLRIRGRGWPQIHGWDVKDVFLTEDQFSQELDEAAVVLIPYSRYFQSGVAVQALEKGVPVVGRRTEFLTAILGEDYAGLVGSESVDDWLRAVGAAAQGDLTPTCVTEGIDAAWRIWAGGAARASS